MRVQHLMFLAFIWVMLTLVGLMFSGSWIGSTEVTLCQYLTGYNSFFGGGVLGFISTGIGFFTHGLPKLILFDYPFLQGGMSIIRFILIAVFATGTVYAVAQDSRVSTTSIFGRR